ncbi:conserved repeat domain-containing protein [Streptomyces sp. TLI_053]|uniref:DUF7507 domain-containing protein n=1 Tax=Streptomyces sp. TLI_053 TaxID=1855352 RepID=UPI00087CD7F7|nr:DUF11 domain-containing protein [Streptomyces sp. TLI_053]SDT83170.1 conserved repeat domain-containing protein [Streptomyces sp. TLI_053]
MVQNSRPSPRRPLVVATVGLVLAVSGPTPVLAQGVPGPAHPVSAAEPRAVRADCPPVPLWANTGGATRTLIEYDSTGAVLFTAPLARDYGDIAFSPDGSKLYGASFPDEPSLYTIDPATGAETATVAVTGPLATVTAVNGLTAAANGMLIVGAFTTGQIFLLDPATGVSTLAPYAFPAGVVSAGDFLTLADGDILAFGNPAGAVFGDPSPVFRIHPDNTVTQIGTAPQTFGAAQSGGSVYAFASDGTINRLNSVPTAASTDPLPVTAVVATGAGFYGATAPQDSGTCATPTYTVAKGASPSGPVDEGGTITYTVNVTNTGTVPANADFTDDLGAVLDDATLVPGSVTATTGSASVTGSTLTYTGVLSPGGTATVTYRVTVNTPDTGDRALTNSATPTGQGGTCATAGGCTTTVPVNAPTRGVTVVKSAGEPAFTGPGQVLHYSYVVTNTGSQPLTNVAVTDQGPGTPTVTCPVTVLAAGASTTCTATYTTTDADVADRKVVNTATATGTAPGGGTVTGPSNPVTVPYAGLKVEKRAQETAFSAAGQTIHYTFTVTNTGAAPVTNLHVDDIGPGTPQVTCPVAVLAAGASTTCTAEYTTTTDDLRAGRITDRATVTGSGPGGTPVTATSNTVTVPSCRPCEDHDHGHGHDDCDDDHPGGGHGHHPGHPGYGDAAWTPGDGGDQASVQPAEHTNGRVSADGLPATLAATGADTTPAAALAGASCSPWGSAPC